MKKLLYSAIALALCLALFACTNRNSPGQSSAPSNISSEEDAVSPPASESSAPLEPLKIPHDYSVSLPPYTPFATLSKAVQRVLSPLTQADREYMEKNIQLALQAPEHPDSNGVTQITNSARNNAITKYELRGIEWLSYMEQSHSTYTIDEVLPLLGKSFLLSDFDKNGKITSMTTVGDNTLPDFAIVAKYKELYFPLYNVFYNPEDIKKIEQIIDDKIVKMYPVEEPFISFAFIKGEKGEYALLLNSFLNNSGYASFPQDFVFHENGTVTYPEGLVLTIPEAVRYNREVDKYTAFSGKKAETRNKLNPFYEEPGVLESQGDAS